MKQALVILFIISTLFGCVKPNPPQTYTPEFWNWADTIYGMSAIINDVAYLCDSAMCTYSEAMGWKSVSGTSADNISIAITSTDFSVGGVYPLKTGTSNSSSVYIPASGEVFSSTIGTNGECKIIENDATHIKGLFYFETSGPISGSKIKIQKGYFKIAK